MSRIRQIKPSWFLDKQLRRGTTADAREFYIGLWMLADDAGYLEWDEERFGAELYPYDGVSRREKLISGWAEVLETLDPLNPHLIVWNCGHARVPKMPGHQRIAGRQSFNVRAAHLGDAATLTPPGLSCLAAKSRREPTVATDDGETHVATSSPGRVGNGIGTVGNGTREPAASNEAGGGLPFRFEDVIAGGRR